MASNEETDELEARCRKRLAQLNQALFTQKENGLNVTFIADNSKNIHTKSVWSFQQTASVKLYIKMYSLCLLHTAAIANIGIVTEDCSK